MHLVSITGIVTAADRRCSRCLTQSPLALTVLIPAADSLLGSFLWPQECALSVPRPSQKCHGITTPEAAISQWQIRVVPSNLLNKMVHYVPTPMLCHLPKYPSENETHMCSLTHTILDSLSCLFLTSSLPCKIPNQLLELNSMSLGLFLDNPAKDTALFIKAADLQKENTTVHDRNMAEKNCGTSIW